MLKMKREDTNKVDYNQYSKCEVNIFPNMFNKSKLFPKHVRKPVVL